MFFGLPDSSHVEFRKSYVTNVKIWLELQKNQREHLKTNVSAPVPIFAGTDMRATTLGTLCIYKNR